ncbi:hypothetical protein [Polynucleobacter sphagniphilus]|uniref:hypothetical protein n=1 Tax=Polynucleobacter sphagniphilus TaxID=1743169 RepID=UPI00096BB0A1|nr:hypothetical protein [Polynucleobacter sphagniphilus]OLY97124.1 hypothetical protein BOQ04_00035 [Polynucleobacter sphagniphilus]
MSLFKINIQISRTLGIFGICVMICLALLLKESDVRTQAGAQNLEATYHALFTIESLRQNKMQDHWLLPTVTLGQENDAFAPWGATVPTNSGDHIYTSFTSPGFVLPYAVFEMLDLDVTVKNLARFNMAIGGMLGIALYLLILRMLLVLGCSKRISIAAGLVGVSIAFFSREALLSTGLIYWPHALYQLSLIFSLHLLFNIFTKPVYSDDWKKSSNILLPFLFFGAWTEWTGYIFNLGLVLILSLKVDNVTYKKLAIKIFLTTIAAGVFTILHYSLVVGFHEYFDALSRAFLSRNANAGNVSGLIAGYVLSYGFFLMAVLMVLIWGSLLGLGIFKKPTTTAQQSEIVGTVLLASIFPLIENFIMLEHATQFSFDRLKFIIPSAILISLGFAFSGVWFRLLLFALIVLASFHGYASHNDHMKNYSRWPEHHYANIALIQRLKEQVDFKCATFGSNLGVRAYANLLIGRSVYARSTPEQVIALNIEKGGCASIFLEGNVAYPDLPSYSNVKVLKLEDFFLSDGNWLNGVARRWAGFYTSNTSIDRANFKVGNSILFQNGDIRKIVKISENGFYLNVWVDGDILNPNEVGFPSKFKVAK